MQSAIKLRVVTISTLSRSKVSAAKRREDNAKFALILYSHIFRWQNQNQLTHLTELDQIE